MAAVKMSVLFTNESFCLCDTTEVGDNLYLVVGVGACFSLSLLASEPQSLVQTPLKAACALSYGVWTVCTCA